MRRSASGATTALDVPQKPSAPQTQTRPGSLFHELEKTDQWLSHKIHTMCFGAGDYIVFVPAFVFSAYVIPLVLLATYFFMPIRAWTEALLGCLATLAFTTALKLLFARIRPAPHVLPPRRFNLRSLEKNHAMPSGDSAQAGMFCTMLALYFGQLALLLGIPATQFGRIYFGCHWIGDTIVRATMGAAIALGVHSGTASLCSSAAGAYLPNLCSVAPPPAKIVA